MAAEEFLKVVVLVYFTSNLFNLEEETMIRILYQVSLFLINYKHCAGRTLLRRTFGGWNILLAKPPAHLR